MRVADRARLVAACAATVLGIGLPVHHARHTHVVHVRTSAVYVCDSTLWVWYALERPDGRGWTFLQDDGSASVEAQTGRRWVHVPSTSGGEGVRRVVDPTVEQGQLVRVKHGASGWVSSPRPVEWGCPKP